MAGLEALIDLTVESKSKPAGAKTPHNQIEITKPHDIYQNTKITPHVSPATASRAQSPRPLGSSNQHSIESRTSLGFSKQASLTFHKPQNLASSDPRTSRVQNTSGEGVRIIDSPVFHGPRKATAKSFVDLTRDDGGNSRPPPQLYPHPFNTQRKVSGEAHRSILTDPEDHPSFRFPPFTFSPGAERTQHQQSDRGKSVSTPVNSSSFIIPEARVGVLRESPVQKLEGFSTPRLESTADWAVLRSSAQKSATEAAVSNRTHWHALESITQKTAAEATRKSPHPTSPISKLSGLDVASHGAETQTEPALKEPGKPKLLLNASNGSESEIESEDEADQRNGTISGLSRKDASPSGTDEEVKARKSLIDTPAQASETEEHDLENKMILLLLPSFQDVLQKHVGDLREDHEYYMKLRLLRARRKCESRTTKTRNSVTSNSRPASDCPRAPSPKFVQASSPFATIKCLDLTVATWFDRQSHSVGKLHQHLIRGAKQESLKLAVPCTSYGSSTIKLPPYTNYISSRGNILTEDEEQTTYFPYHGDDPPIDADYIAFEARVGESIRRFQNRNDYAERAKHYAPYACRFLEEVGCGFQDVLRYLLDETNPVVPIEMSDASTDYWLNRESHLDEDYYLSTDAEDGEFDTITPKRGRPKSTSQDKKVPEVKRRRPPKWQSIFERLPPSDPRTSAVAGLACAAFRKVAGFSIWHIAKTYPLDLENADGEKSPYAVNFTTGRSRGFDKEEPNGLGTYTDLGCLVCFAHECPGHGEFTKEDSIENTRIRANTKPLSPKIAKINGIEVPQSTDINQLIGMNDDGSISGLANDEMTDLDTGFSDDKLCSDSCFWRKANRAGLEVTPWAHEDRELFQALLPAYVHNKRAACMIALAVRKSCVEIFAKIQQPSSRPTCISVKARNSTAMPQRSGPKRNGEYWHEHSKTWKHHDRPPFRPCNHQGPCSVANECSCCIEGVTCEKTCMCANNCSRRFLGCSCATRGKVCWGNDKCDCFFLDRECDPDLCGTCGARQVLDPVNRYRDDIAKAKCANVYVQRGVPKHTLLGHSKLLASGGVSGWGLYMGEPVRAGDYLGEYVGEVISHEEAERRGAIYNRRNLSYLFDLNTKQTLDSTRIGNKFRYINHQAPPYANCKAKVLLCNTVHRIGMFALRNVEIGEELLFDYGPSFASQFVAVKLHPNAPPTLERPKKGVAQKKVSDVRHATAKKTGARIGRPRKYSPNGTPIKRPNLKQRSDSKVGEDRAGGSFGLENLFDVPSDRAGDDAEEAASEDDEVAMSEEVNFEEGSSSEDESYHESDEMEIEDPIPVPAALKKKEKEKEKTEPEYENPQKRGWKTRYANMLKRKRGL